MSSNKALEEGEKDEDDEEEEHNQRQEEDGEQVSESDELAQLFSEEDEVKMFEKPTTLSFF